jgi:hypothetical protein
MAKRDVVRETLERLQSLAEGDPGSAEAIAALRNSAGSSV